jgi:hypothetical protein
MGCYVIKTNYHNAKRKPSGFANKFLGAFLAEGSIFKDLEFEGAPSFVD